MQKQKFENQIQQLLTIQHIVSKRVVKGERNNLSIRSLIFFIHISPYQD